MIGNFPTKKNYNPGGLKSFSFAPSVTIANYPAIVAGSANAELLFKTGFYLLNGYATANTLQFNQEEGETDQGVLHEQNLQGFVPLEGAEIVALFAEMVQMRFVCVAKDFNGIKKLLGSVLNPLVFSYKYSSGNDRKDAKGYKFSFARTTEESAPIYPF